jgi:hypothetical protein
MQLARGGIDGRQVGRLGRAEGGGSHDENQEEKKTVFTHQVIVYTSNYRARSSCYTGFVLKNVTITVEEEQLKWARKKAAEENTSVSRLVGRMLEDQMRQTDEYWSAYERWKRIKPIPGLAKNRLTREEANERRR